MRNKPTLRWISAWILFISCQYSILNGQIEPLSPLFPIGSNGWNAQICWRNLFESNVVSSQTFINYSAKGFIYSATHTGIFHPLASYHITSADIQIPWHPTLSGGLGASRFDWLGDESQNKEWGISWRINWQPGQWKLSSHGVTSFEFDHSSLGHSVVQASYSPHQSYEVQSALFMGMNHAIQLMIGLEFIFSPKWSATLGAIYPRSFLGFGMCYTLGRRQALKIDNYYHLSLGHSPGVTWQYLSGNLP